MNEKTLPWKVYVLTYFPHNLIETLDLSVYKWANEC